MGREREVGKAIPAAKGNGLGLDSAALCHDLFGVCADEVDAAPHMCGFEMARLNMPGVDTWCCLWTTRTVTAHRS